ncbi:PAS domain-containing protein [cf. Phormidesmis sp. LEGE 11477]|uniref:PAS domain-containing sensor histidine kinase n=1 Tax=cf. Phormidesmis sp. LEGE 11477 TaxID=1828680 RepID=UPI00187EF39B|nr:PAS domain-containing protein [cf. Phormidesmis sp. LEGE 11477]MBE9061173.1 PAS domain-containing protein [cf. Phormidesmis sp. LEGE 11477]
MTFPIASACKESVVSASSVDSQAIYQVLWDDDYIGRAVLEVLEQGKRFRFLKLNSAIAQSSLFPTADIIGKTLSAVTSTQLVSRYQNHCADCVQTKKTVRFELSQTTEPYLEQWWLVTVAPIKDTADCVYQLVLSATDISESKRLEADLKMAAKDADEIIDHVQESIVIHDPSGKILRVNKSFLELYKVTYADALRFRISHEYATPETPVHLLPELWSRALAGEKIEFEWPAKRPYEGSLVSLEVSLQRIYLSGQVRLMACLRDVSDRKQVEEKQKRLLDILEATPDFVEITDAEGNCLYINQAGQKIIGLLEERPVNDLHISMLMPAHQAETFQNTIIPHAIEHGSWVGEQQLTTLSGETMPVSQVIITHKDSSGKLKYISTIAQDISELKLVEAKLRDREQFLNNIYSVTSIAIFSWDVDENDPSELRCSDWNPACEAATGMCADKVLGKTPAEVFGVEQGKTVTRNLTRCIDQRKTIAYEEEILIGEEPTWWSTKLNPISDETDQIYRVVGTTTNITELKLNTLKLEAYSKNQTQQTEQLTAALSELKRTQAQIVQSEKMSSLGQMVAGVAHEINNPVNFIHANIEPACTYAADLIEIISFYQREYPQPSVDLLARLEELDFDFIQQDFTKLLSSMKVGTHRIREIVLSLRNFSRLDEAEVKAVDLHQGLDSTLVILAHKIKADGEHEGIEIIKDYQLTHLVECYPSQINQVVMNLLANAIDALGQTSTPRIKISTRLHQDQAVITISDNGPGIPETVRARIFDPFFTTKPVGKGTGMGLSISYQIVTEKHKGTLSVSSEPGQSTQFIISIPLWQ